MKHDTIMCERRPSKKEELTSNLGFQEKRELMNKEEEPVNLLLSLRAQSRLDISVGDK